MVRMGKVRIRAGTCVFCGGASYVEVDERLEERVKAFLAHPRAHRYVQQEFPSLSPDVRETMVSGAHGDCFDRAFNNE